MGTHADYVAAVAQSCTSLYTRLATHRPVVALRTHLQPRLHDLTSTSRASGNIVVKPRLVPRNTRKNRSCFPKCRGRHICEGVRRKDSGSAEDN